MTNCPGRAMVVMRSRERPPGEWSPDHLRLMGALLLQRARLPDRRWGPDEIWRRDNAPRISLATGALRRLTILTQGAPLFERPAGLAAERIQWHCQSSSRPCDFGENH